ncbi:MAG TPA: nucleotidyltransferase domain-containing protein [Ktedonobacterales bacterium]
MHLRSLPPGAETALEVIAAFERAFPGRLRSAYVLGSYADATATPASDLDLTLVFRDSFLGQREIDEVRRVTSETSARGSIELDIEITDEATLRLGASPALKLASAIIGGDDRREEWPLIPIEEWTRDRMHTSWWRIARLFERPSPIVPPLESPEPDSQFLGYTRRTVRLSDGSDAPCTRDLIRLTGWAATALVALECGVYAPSKREAHRLYAACVGGEWTGLLSAIYEECRQRWAYVIPEGPDERARLRELCEQTLLFERHFMSRYTAYALGELRSSDERVFGACEALRRAPLAQTEIVDVLRLLTTARDSAMRNAAKSTLLATTPYAQPR